MELIISCLTVLIVSLAAWDFGRRWLNRQDYRIDLDALTKDVQDNKIRIDKAISNLALQTQETVRELEKKQNALLGGTMLRPGNRRPPMGHV